MNRIFFILRSSFDHIIHNPLLNVLSILSLSLAYLIFNTSLLVFMNLQSAVKRWEKSFVIIAYIKDGTDSEEIRNTMEMLKKNEMVKDIDYVSKDEALKKFREQLGNNSFFLEGLDVNPLPAYFVITPVGGSAVEPLIEMLKKTDDIEEIQYEKEVILKFINALGTIRFLSGILNLFVLVSVIFIVSNTIRLSFFARRDEIEIMKLVGASDIFVGAPYVIESAWQNLVSMVISILSLYFLYEALLKPLSDSLSFLFGVRGFTFFDTKSILLSIAIALTIGIAGGFISIRRYLKI